MAPTVFEIHGRDGSWAHVLVPASQDVLDWATALISTGLVVPYFDAATGVYRDLLVAPSNVALVRGISGTDLPLPVVTNWLAKSVSLSDITG